MKYGIKGELYARIEAFYLLRKVFLDELPKIKREDRYINNWKASVGYKVKFIYEDIKGEVEIVNYQIKDKQVFLDIKYNNKVLSFSSTSFLRCHIGELLGKINKSYKYNIGDIVGTKSGNIQILKQIRIGKSNVRGYKYKCLVDGNIDKINEYQLVNNHQGCNVCSNYKILKGVNDLWTTHPEIAKMLKYPERGNELTYGLQKDEIFICPDCGLERSFRVQNIVRRGFLCPRCADHISYPNKFVRNFLEQINENFYPEYFPMWSEGRIYDNYLPDRKEIWEVHGMQHYKKSFNSIDARTLLEEQENDRIKKALAEKNGYKYIEIDARNSELEWIKNSLENLPEIKRYDLNKVDWLECHEFACSSLVKATCDYWASGIRDTTEIANIMKLDRVTVVIYLKRGAKLNWCDYDSNIIMLESGRNLGKLSSRRCIIQLSKNGDFIKKWDSIAEAARSVNLKASTNLSSVCQGKQKTAGGFIWMYEEDYDRSI